MIDYLSTRHNVAMMSLPSSAKRAVRYVKSINKCLPFLGIGTEWLGKLVLSLNRVSSEDILVCNEGQVRRGLIPSVIDSFSGRKVLLMRDLVTRDFVEQMRGSFDIIYSYDRNQCAAFGMEYLPQFFPFGYFEARQMVEARACRREVKRCFFLGRDKGRTDEIEALARVLEAKGSEVDFAIVRDCTSNAHSRFYIDDILSYEQNIEKSVAADVLVEINQEGQSGLTLRTLEAAFFNKKLITSNVEARACDFYRPENIFIADEGSFVGLEAFLEKEPVLIEREVLSKHTPEHMLERIIADTQAEAAPA
ncbi:hypothetical protein [Pseudomonas chlororaphis]|uniref:hypothetical protein n=1 Tax=Pseudomonas chlororaphis TaxID=587753 RepID=UPI0015DECF2D|nr:hypothetical protein [Pseudomonas chlororaphis]QLL13034.1 hypothetical protein H0I86_29365 [Pseudomonas chlororaphis subsp. aurantiaca]